MYSGRLTSRPSGSAPGGSPARWARRRGHRGVASPATTVGASRSDEPRAANPMRRQGRVTGKRFARGTASHEDFLMRVSCWRHTPCAGSAGMNARHTGVRWHHAPMGAWVPLPSGGMRSRARMAVRPTTGQTSRSSFPPTRRRRGHAHGRISTVPEVGDRFEGTARGKTEAAAGHGQR